MSPSMNIKEINFVKINRFVTYNGNLLWGSYDNIRISCIFPRGHSLLEYQIISNSTCLRYHNYVMQREPFLDLTCAFDIWLKKQTEGRSIIFLIYLVLGSDSMLILHPIFGFITLIETNKCNQWVLFHFREI